jgi:branched-chain amino acid transport system substrate-binding protein
LRARLLLVLACAQLGAAACSGPLGNSLPSGPVGIGLVTSLTGIDLELGVDARLGAQQAVDEVNAQGGVDGHPASLLVADDAGSAAAATAAAAGMLRRHVAGFIGPVNPAAATAVAGWASPKRIPLLSTWGDDQLAGSPGTFLAAPSAGRVAERMLEYARTAKLTTLAIAHPTGDAYADAGVAALKADAARYGAGVVSDQPFDPATVDFGPLLSAVRSSGAGLLLVWGGGTGPPLLERAWKPSGLQAPILLSPVSATTAFLRAVSDSGEGAQVATTESLLAGSLPAGSPIRRQVDPMASSFLKRNGYYPTQAAFDGYAAARLLLKAIADAGSVDPRSVDAALARLRLATAAGTFQYGPKDHLGMPTSWLAIATIKDGRLTPAV